MKRFLSIAILFLLTIPLTAQEFISRDENDLYTYVSTGISYDRSGGFIFPIERTGIGLAYLLDKKSGAENYMLFFELETVDMELSVDQNAFLYIKTFQDNIIALKQLETCDKINMRKSVRIKEVGKGDFTVCSIFPSYTISKEDLQIIMNEGVKKFAFMTTATIYTIVYKEDIIGKILVKDHELIHKNVDFSEDF
jgi:hypothetical protein